MHLSLVPLVLYYACLQSKKKMLGQCEEIFPSATSVIILESAELKRLILELTQLTGQMISRISGEYYGISKIVDF